MKKVLIPTDFSLNNFNTIDYTINLFKDVNCDFFFLHAYNYDINDLDAVELLQRDKEWFDKPKDNSLEQLGKLKERFCLSQNNPGHRFQIISECLPILDAIKKNIKGLDIDLVVLSKQLKEKISKRNQIILNKVRNCPILLVPAHAGICNKLNLTIVSDFKNFNLNDLEKLTLNIRKEKIKISIMILARQPLSDEAANNLMLLIVFLKQYQKSPAEISYAVSNNQIASYAQSNQGEIICLVDKKPGVFRKIGLLKSEMISKLEQLRNSTVLAIHQ